MTRVVLRSKAEHDIAEIWAYIAQNSEAQADAFVKRLDAQFHLLAQRPALGRRRQELTPTLRSFPLGRYIIFYLPINGGISVIRVLHSARDIAQKRKRRNIYMLVRELNAENSSTSASDGWKSGATGASRMRDPLPADCESLKSAKGSPLA